MNTLIYHNTAPTESASLGRFTLPIVAITPTIDYKKNAYVDCISTLFFASPNVVFAFFIVFILAAAVALFFTICSANLIGLIPVYAFIVAAILCVGGLLICATTQHDWESGVKIQVDKIADYGNKLFSAIESNIKQVSVEISNNPRICDDNKSKIYISSIKPDDTIDYIYYDAYSKRTAEGSLKLLFKKNYALKSHAFYCGDIQNGNEGQPSDDTLRAYIQVHLIRFISVIQVQPHIPSKSARKVESSVLTQHPSEMPVERLEVSSNGR